MTYTTYQAAKIDNQDSEIVTTAPNWNADRNLAGTFERLEKSIHWINDYNGWTICNPADYCMTVKQFLDAGNKGVNGDLYLNKLGELQEIGVNCGEDWFNEPNLHDDERYVIKAKALEETKTYRYEKVELSPKEIFMAMLKGEKFYVLGDLLNFDGEQFWRHTEEGKSRITYIKHDHEIHRRIEVTERELFLMELNKLHDEYSAMEHDEVKGSLYDYIADSGKFKLVNGKG